MTESVATPKKSKSAAKTKKPKVAATHPKTADMVNAAIAALKERGGSSLQAIKKYIAANYKVDADKLAPFIRKYLKSAVVSGGLVQTKGKGASGSFRMAGSAGTGGAKTAAKPKKAAAKPKKAKAAPATPKKAAKPKKSPAKSKPKKAAPVKKAKPAPKTAVKKAKPVKAAKKKPAKASPKKKAAPKKAKK